MNKLILSTLAHTWILDLDGTIVKHNGYKLDGTDTLLEGAKEKDMIVFLTSRTDEYKNKTINFLNENKIRYDHIIFNAPYGERILVNDDKPSGLHMSIGINKKRDEKLCINIEEDSMLWSVNFGIWLYYKYYDDGFIIPNIMW